MRAAFGLISILVADHATRWQEFPIEAAVVKRQVQHTEITFKCFSDMLLFCFREVTQADQGHVIFGFQAHADEFLQAGEQVLDR